jgi:DNA-binding NarL/FixJ family response regulator
LPDGNGVELIAWLHEHCPQVTTVVISAFGDEETVLAALRAGAVGYLLKEREDIELRLALQSIQRGGAPIDPFIARRILALLSSPPPPTATAQADERDVLAGENTLSDRESEILQLVARGYSNREIAELTTLSRFTIEGYTKTIYRKLAVRSRTAAVFEAKNLGLLH